MLQEFKERAIQAYNWTSFSPERRGESTIKEAEAELESDIQELRKGGVSEESIQAFIEKFKSLFSSWLGAKSRCISSMITGPANFPVRRAEKANRSEHKHYEVFQEWRRRAVKRIIRNNQPKETFVSEIEKLEKQLASKRKFQESAKEINKIIKSKKLTKEQKLQALGKMGYQPHEAERLFEPDFAGRVGIPAYALQNNNANMKRIEARIAELKQKEEKREQIGEKEFEFEGGVVVVNYEKNRLQIIYNAKPSEEVRKELKGNGFRWAPSENAWQRFINNGSAYAVKRVTGVNVSI